MNSYTCDHSHKDKRREAMSKFTTEDILEQVRLKAAKQHYFPKAGDNIHIKDWGALEFPSGVDRLKKLIDHFSKYKNWTTLEEATNQIYHFWEVLLWSCYNKPNYLPFISSIITEDCTDWREAPLWPYLEAVWQVLSEYNFFEVPVLARVLVFHFITQRDKIDENFISTLKQELEPTILLVSRNIRAEHRSYPGEKGRKYGGILRNLIIESCPRVFRKDGLETKHKMKQDRLTIETLHKIRDIFLLLL